MFIINCKIITETDCELNNLLKEKSDYYTTSYFKIISDMKTIKWHVVVDSITRISRYIVFSTTQVQVFLFVY